MKMLCDTAHTITRKKTGSDREEAKVEAVQGLIDDLVRVQGSIPLPDLTGLI